ncbi:MAG TPA: hypothetical protein VHE83_11315 [Mycobacteriales bacterium]|nr:hypothetical protein [Mycobacteriales bacterium]
MGRPTLVQVPSADGVTALVARLADRAADLVLRTGVSADRAGPLVEASAIALVDALATDPSSVGDPAGVWFADLHADAVRVRDAQPAAPAAAPRKRGAKRADAGAPGDPVQQLERALGGLDERRALALLLRDSYDLPWPSVGPALGLSEAEGATVVAEARQQLLLALDGTQPVPLTAHGALSGISYGALARLADADAIDQHDPLGVARAQHARTCPRCGEFVAGQRTARRALAALPVRALPDVEHERIVRAVEAHATSLLPSAAVLQEQAVAPRPPSLLLSALLLIGAAGVGVTIGALVSHGPNDRTIIAAPSVSASATPTTSRSAKPSRSASASVSASPSATVVTPSATVTRSTRPTATRTSTAVVTRTSPPPSRPVAAAITLSPTGGPRNTVITVSGVGFTPGDMVTVTYRNGILASSSTNAVVGADGTFSASVTASDALGGTHTVTARDQHGVSASTTFEQG